jgi:hypothetical protein
MSITAEQKAETIFALAADMAKKLGMRRKNDMTTLRFGQPVMLVTEAGFTVSTIRGTHGREDDYRYDIYSMDETKLCSYTFSRVPGSSDSDPCWEETPIVETSLPEGVVLYAGRIPKSELRTTRRTSTRY